MSLWPRHVPIAVRLPLIAGVMIFVVAVASTQIAIHAMSSQIERQIETIGRVYLDGLSAALLPYLHTGDTDGARAALTYAFDFHEGVAERHLALLDGDQVSLRVDHPARATTSLALPPEVYEHADGVAFRQNGESVWAWRTLENDGQTFGTIVANLDVSRFLRERQRLRWLLIGGDLLFSSLLAALGYVIARRMQKPIGLLASRLQAASSGDPEPIPASDIPAKDRDIARTLHAYNGMVAATKEREKMIAELAQKDHEAVLGRLIATIAHEVRNPLAGILTAVGTARKFGDQPAARTDALDFIERGILTLQNVADATLETHRAQASWRDLKREDLNDVHILAAADARSRGVAVDMSLDLPERMPVGATETRQVLLNLLLNAVAASPRGARVKWQGRADGDALQFDIWDDGPGLPKALGDRLTGDSDAPRGPGLGLDVVSRLIERLHGHIAVKTKPGAGTHIVARFPFRNAEGQDRPAHA